MPTPQFIMNSRPYGPQSLQKGFQKITRQFTQSKVFSVFLFCSMCSMFAMVFYCFLHCSKYVMFFYVFLCFMFSYASFYDREPMFQNPDSCLQFSYAFVWFSKLFYHFAVFFNGCLLILLVHIDCCLICLLDVWFFSIQKILDFESYRFLSIQIITCSDSFTLSKNRYFKN